MLNSQQIATYNAALDFAERQVKSLIETHPDFFPMYTVGGKWRHDGREVDALDRWFSGRDDVAVSCFANKHDSWREKAEHYSKLLEASAARPRTCMTWDSFFSAPTCRGTS